MNVKKNVRFQNDCVNEVVLELRAMQFCIRGQKAFIVICSATISIEMTLINFRVDCPPLNSITIICLRYIVYSVLISLNP